MRIQQSHNFCLLLADKFQWSMGIKTEINSTLLARFSAFKYKTPAVDRCFWYGGLYGLQSIDIQSNLNVVKSSGWFAGQWPISAQKGPPTSRGPLIIKCCESRIDLMGGLFYFSQKQSARNLCIKVISVLFLWLLRHRGWGWDPLSS